MSERIGIGLVGGRGHVGTELIALIAGHPRFELRYASSRERVGQRVADHVHAYVGEVRYTTPTHEQLPALDAEAVVLALPNGKARELVAAFDGAAVEPVLIDLSADYRFDDAWVYGLPELARRTLGGARRISNPGCYATAMQLALGPLLDVLDGPAQCFGVSGYSGAGTTPSDKNDPDVLLDNLLPYALAGHVHEAEVTRQLGHPVEFMPHVASHFRGLTITANAHLTQAMTLEDVIGRYRARYAYDALVEVLATAPRVRDVAGTHGVQIGGFTLAADGRRVVVVATLDNLLKGAATQALQNLNLAFGLDELAGIPAGAIQSGGGQPTTSMHPDS